jgi:hypothetical protein
LVVPCTHLNDVLNCFGLKGVFGPFAQMQRAGLRSFGAGSVE